MKQENQLIALLEYMGWKGPYSQRWLYGFEKEGGDLWAFAGTNPEGEDEPVPELTLDLMHKAECSLSREQHALFARELHYHLTWMNPQSEAWENRAKAISATATQRLEAFLKTVGKWREKT